MNIRQISSHVVIVIVAVIGTLIAVNVLKPTTVSRTKQIFEIKYEVNAAGDQLEITTPENVNCVGVPKKGCVKIKKNDKGDIKFVFNGDVSKWFLDQFKICKGVTKITADCSKPLTLDERLEFFVMNDATVPTILITPASGMVDLAPLGAGINTFYLFDQNTIAQTYFYNIRVCTVPDPNIPQKCLTLDPPIENKGLN